MDDIICLFCKHRQPLSGGCKAFTDEIPFEFSSGEKEHREKEAVFYMKIFTNFGEVLK